MPDMRIREVLSRDPLTTVIPNDGVTKVIQPQSENEWDVLRYELESFVCEGEYRQGLDRILSAFLSKRLAASATGRLGERLLRQRKEPSSQSPRIPLA